MQFTPGQLRRAVRLSKETFRHWKRVLPELFEQTGRSARFSIGDVLAFAVLRQLTDNCGVRIGNLKNVAGQLLTTCNSVSWITQERRLLLIDLPTGQCIVIQNLVDIPLKNALIICPLERVIKELRDELLASQDSTEPNQLPLPLLHVSREAGSRRGNK